LLPKIISTQRKANPDNKEILCLLQINQEALFNKAMFLTKNPHDAKDLFQELCFKILKHKDAYRSGTNFPAWSNTLLRNLFINGFRKKIRHRKKSKEFMQIDYWRASSCENTGLLNLEYQDVENVLNSLEEKHKTPIMMLHQGYVYDEISQHLNLPLGTIKSRIFLARKELKKKISLEN